MPDCCDPGAYRVTFDTRHAERSLRTYRRRGLDGRAADLLAYLTSRGLGGNTVLEVGGGIGQFQVEMLKAGAESAVNVELSPEYELTATTLLEEEGLTGLVDRRVGDFVEESGSVGAADVVVLNRVVCCYPFMERLVDAAGGHAARFLALSIPWDRWLGHFFVGSANVTNRLRSNGFRAYIHPVAAIRERAAGAGLEVVHSSRDWVWQGIVFERLTSDGLRPRHGE